MMLRKWQYVRDRLVSEGDIVGAKMANEIDEVVMGCRYREHTRWWEDDWELGRLERRDIYIIIGSRFYCTACIAEDDMCLECEFNQNGGERIYNKLCHHRRKIFKGDMK